MLKKVLSVVLALVLALGVCVVAASAATASQLQGKLDSLPSEYNATFYNDATKALILEARAAAEAALESGTGIDAACALCDEAYDEANAGEEIWCDAIDDYMWIYTNRDESKAVADFYYETDAPDYLMPGDTFNITVSVKTNFYVRTMYTGFAYDKTKFEYVTGSITYPDAIKDTLDVENGSAKADWGYNSLGNEMAGGFPDTWTADMKAQYNLFEKVFMLNSKGTDFFYPAEETELYTLTMKVKDDAVLDETARIFVNNDLCATRDNYLLGSYNYALVEFTRAYGPQIKGVVTDMDGYRTEAWKVSDETAASGQTINFNGDYDFTVTIGEAPVTLDYSELEAAIAVKDTLKAADYTDASWAAYDAAVEAGKTEGLKATTQDDIDAYTAAINKAYDELEDYVAPASKILNIEAKTTPIVGSYVTLEVLVSEPATKIQFVSPDGNTLTFYDGYERVESVVVNDDGTQTWIVTMMVYNDSQTYNAFPKFGRVWDTNPYRFVLEDTHEYDGNIYSVTVPDAYDGRVKQGRHYVVVETGIDVTKVQFSYLGTTATYTADSEKLISREEKDGHYFWTINFNFCTACESFTAELLSRTATSKFAKSDVTLVVDVLH